MNLLPLRYFVAVAEEGGISKGARRLCVTQQTLSAHMAALEKELSCTLFRRRPSFALTPEGERLLQYARSMGALYDSMVEEFSDFGHQQRAVLRVGVAHTRGRVLMPRLLPRFQAEHPQVHVVLRERSNEGLETSLLADRTDVAIAQFSGNLPELETTPLYHETILLVAPRALVPAGATGVADLARVPFLLGASADIAGRAAQAEFERAGISPQVTVRSDNVETLLALCAEGLGACFCPDTLLQAALGSPTPDPERFWVLPVGDPYPISIAHLKRPYISEAIRAFEEFCRRVLGPNGTNSQ